MKDKSSQESKIKLWTAQNQIVVDTIQEQGVYQVKKEFIEQKYQQVSDIFLEAYNWYINQAKKLVPKPKGAEYPVWLTTKEKYLDYFPGERVLELEVDRDKVIIVDNAKWNRVLNLSYIPIDEQDQQEHEEELKRYNLSDDSKAYLSNHYPYLKSKIKNSWDRLFDNSIQLSDVTRASLWQIKEEWVLNID